MLIYKILYSHIKLMIPVVKTKTPYVHMIEVKFSLTLNLKQILSFLFRLCLKTSQFLHQPIFFSKTLLKSHNSSHHVLMLTLSNNCPESTASVWASKLLQATILPHVWPMCDGVLSLLDFYFPCHLPFHSEQDSMYFRFWVMEVLHFKAPISLKVKIMLAAVINSIKYV